DDLPSLVEHDYTVMIQLLGGFLPYRVSKEPYELNGIQYLDSNRVHLPIITWTWFELPTRGEWRTQYVTLWDSLGEHLQDSSNIAKMEAITGAVEPHAENLTS